MPITYYPFCFPPIGMPMTIGAQAQTGFPTLPPMCPVTGPTLCPPSVGCPQGQAQAQTGFITLPPFCPPTIICPQANAQAQTVMPPSALMVCPTMITTCALPTGGNAHAQTGFTSIPPICPQTGPAFCPPSIGCPQGQAQAQTAMPPSTLFVCPSMITVCTLQNANQAQAQTGFTTLPPICPVTGPTVCPPSVGCPQAQAQAQTVMPPSTLFVCPSMITVCTLQNANQAQAQTGVPTLPPICPVTGPTVCPPSVGCPQGQAQAQTVMPPSTLFVCPSMITVCTLPNANQAQAQTVLPTTITQPPCSCPATVPPVCGANAAPQATTYWWCSITCHTGQGTPGAQAQTIIIPSLSCIYTTVCTTGPECVATNPKKCD